MSTELFRDHHLAHNHDIGPCPMLMVFHGGHCERILWHNWITSDGIEFAFASVALFVLAFFYEALKFLSHKLLKQSASKITPATKLTTAIKPSYSEAPLTGPKRNGYWHEITTKVHIVQTLLYAVQVTISYVLMLIFMNFNYWLCFAVISGLSLGFYGFGWMRRINFLTECCN